MPHRFLHPVRGRCLQLCVAALMMGAAAPAMAQDSTRNEESEDSYAAPPAGPISEGQGISRVTRSSVGRAGERQTRGDTAGVEPMARINNRIPNRLQTRIRNRIDPAYDPVANAISPFQVAAPAKRRTGRVGNR